MEEKKIGIIGTGSLGGMLIRAFTGKGLGPRTRSWYSIVLLPKLKSIKRIYRG